jgi:hypothetical protein
MKYEKGYIGGPGRKHGSLTYKWGKHTRESIGSVFSEMIEYTLPQLQNRMKEPGCTVLEMMIGSVIMKAIKDGDTTRMNGLLDRVIGRPKEEVEIVPFEEQEHIRVLDLIPKEVLLSLVEKTI